MSGTPLLLLCPAWKRWGTATTVKRKSTILHSDQDDVVPFADSKELLAKSGSPDSAPVHGGARHAGVVTCLNPGSGESVSKVEWEDAPTPLPHKAHVSSSRGSPFSHSG